MKTLNSKFSPLNSNLKAFTIIELLVVIGTIVILSSLAITYSKTGERQIILFKEQTSLVGLLIKARSLSFGAFGEAEVPCDYGVNFNESGKAILFREYSPSNDPKCSDANRIYDSSDEKLEELNLDPMIKFSELGLTNVVFIPPSPKVIIDNDENKFEALIKIKTISGSNEKIIKITNAGQITIQ